MNKESDKPAFPTEYLDKDGIKGSSGLRIRQYACIHLGIPETGDEELDNLIRKAERKKITIAAMTGILANPEFLKNYSDKDIHRASIINADALIKQLNNG